MNDRVHRAEYAGGWAPLRPGADQTERQPLEYRVSPLQPMPRGSHWPRHSEIKWGVLVLVGLVLAGLVAGLVWASVAPRLPFRVVQPGEAIATGPEGEAFIAADGLFLVITAVVGVLAGLLSWLPRSARGALMTATLAVGGSAGAVATMVIGQWLAGPPSDATLGRIGALILTPLRLRATAFAVVEGFVAVLVYMALVAFANQEDLGWSTAG